MSGWSRGAGWICSFLSHCEDPDEIASGLHNTIVEITDTGATVNPSYLVWFGSLYHIESVDDYWDCFGQVSGRVTHLDQSLASKNSVFISIRVQTRTGAGKSAAVPGTPSSPLLRAGLVVGRTKGRSPSIAHSSQI